MLRQGTQSDRKFMLNNKVEDLEEKWEKIKKSKNVPKSILRLLILGKNKEQ